MNTEHDKHYYLLIEAFPYGPFNKTTVENHIVSGSLGRDVHVWSSHQDKWVPIIDCIDFLDHQGFIGDQSRPECISTHPVDESDRENPLVQTNLQRPINFDLYDDDLLFLHNYNDKSDRHFEAVGETKNSRVLSNEAVYSFSESPLHLDLPVSENSSGYSVVARKKIIFSVLLVLIISFAAIVYFRNRPSIDYLLLDQLQIDSLARKRIIDFYHGQLSEPALVYPVTDSSGQTALQLFMNSPDNARIIVQLKSVRGSVIDTLYTEITTDLYLVNKTGRTLYLLTKSGDPIPQGYYTVSLSCVGCGNQDTHTVTLDNPMALGINNLAQYHLELKSFKSILKSQAQSEVLEIYEITKLIEDIIDDKISRPQKQSFLQQLESLFTDLTPRVALESYIFNETYTDIKKLIIDIRDGKSNLKKDLARLKRSLEKNRKAINTDQFI
jgi:hypothetical protein